MLVSLKEVFEIANRKRIAIGAFNVSNFESGKAILNAAEAEKTPVILNYACVHAPYLSLEDASQIMLHLAHKATVPVCVHLDHGANFETCIQAIRLGFTSVMIDASSLSYEDNLKETMLVVRAAHSVGVTVEAELGHIFSSETGMGKPIKAIETAESFDNLNDVYTNPQVAKDFVERTHVDALAIAFGTSHGIYVKKPVLDLNRVAEVKKAIDIPLVMHGGSGLSKEEFQGAIRNGIRKINYYTYMTLAGGKAVKKAMDEHKSDDNIFFHDIPGFAIEAMEENIKNTLRIFNNEV